MTQLDFNANNCFVCGPDNPIGLKIKFTIDDDEVCRGRFTPKENHVGYLVRLDRIRITGAAYVNKVLGTQMDQ